MSHTGIETEDVQAHFLFVCMDPKRLTCEVVHQTIAEVLVASGASDPEQELYRQFAAFAQDDGQPSDSGVALPTQRHALKGEYFRVPTTMVDSVLSLKYDDEKEKNRQPGHQSTVAPRFLTQKTLAIVIGSRPYLMLNAELYMERYSIMRTELLLMFRKIGALEKRKGKQTEDTYVHCTPKDKSFYAGNFDALLERVRKEKVAQRVAQLSLADQSEE
jgi:hypothetical protein